MTLENHKRNALIFGSTGFLGSYLCQSLEETFNLFRVVRKQKNIFSVLNADRCLIKSSISYNGIEEIFNSNRFDIVFNAAGYVNVEECAKHPDVNRLANLQLPTWLAKFCKKHHTKFIHYSTDAVFGQEGTMFNEEMKPIPISDYGKSKFLAEQNILGIDSSALIIRTNFFGWANNKKSLFNYFYDGFEKQNKVIGYTNSYFTPIYVKDLVDFSRKMSLADSTGIYHVCGSERISKHEFGMKILENFFPQQGILLEGKMINNSLSTSRNFEMCLDNSKLVKQFGTISHYTNGIKEIRKLIPQGGANENR